MTKNFSAASLNGSTIDTKYFQRKKLNQMTQCNNLKEIGIFLSYLVSKDKQRIVYNPNFPIIYKGKFKEDLISEKIYNISTKIIKKHSDPNYNKNLTIKDVDFGIRID